MRAVSSLPALTSTSALPRVDGRWGANIEPALTTLDLRYCDKVTAAGVQALRTTTTAPSLHIASCVASQHRTAYAGGVAGGSCTQVQGTNPSTAAAAVLRGGGAPPLPNLSVELGFGRSLALRAKTQARLDLEVSLQCGRGHCLATCWGSEISGLPVAHTPSCMAMAMARRAVVVVMVDPTVPLRAPIAARIARATLRPRSKTPVVVRPSRRACAIGATHSAVRTVSTFSLTPMGVPRSTHSGAHNATSRDSGAATMAAMGAWASPITSELLVAETIR
jgi:hypothetical protein